MSPCKNHQHCINEALAHAQQACLKTNATWTPLREQILKLIWTNHKPLGAYDLIDMLAAVSKRRVAPPTVYRTLEFLLELGLVHRINSLNAYIGCTSPTNKHPGYFFICNQCQTVTELYDHSLNSAIDQLGKQSGFTIQQQWLEVLGLCQVCQQQTS